ncbi:MAG: flagellar motor switch protein FliG [Treponema sp.]|nr:flagellar motor switch protein FliG [Treponema sp.]
MTKEELFSKAYNSSGTKKNFGQEPKDGEGFKKFSDAIPDNGFQNGFQKETRPADLPKDKESVYRRVAKFLVMIGENEAAKIIPHLTEEQIMKIVPEIASIRSVSPEERSVILAEFNSLLEQSRESGGVNTAREMLEKAYGKKRAEEMLQKAVPFGAGKPFDYLSEADNERVYYLLKDESTGVQAIVLSHLEPKKAAAVINFMDAEMKKDVVLHLAKMEAISPEVIKRIDKSLHEKSLRQTSEKSENIDGRNALAEILKRMDSGAEKDILNQLSEGDPNLGDDLRSRLFTIDDVIKSDDRFIQEKLRDMADAEIVYLIGGKTDDFREKILSNVSINRKTQILSDEDLLKPLKKVEVDRVTNGFVSDLRRAYERGNLRIAGRNDEQYV